MKSIPKSILPALLASLLSLLTNCWQEQANAADLEAGGGIAHWTDSEYIKVHELAYPFPALLFSLPEAVVSTWMTGAQLRPFQELLCPDDCLIDLCNNEPRLSVYSPSLHELLTTEALIIVKRRSKPTGFYWSSSERDEFRRKSFWLKNQPAPSALHPVSFTSELLSPNDSLSWRSVRNFCDSY